MSYFEDYQKAEVWIIILVLILLCLIKSWYADHYPVERVRFDDKGYVVFSRKEGFFARTYEDSLKYFKGEWHIKHWDGWELLKDKIERDEMRYETRAEEYHYFHDYDPR